jgi:5-methylcytosine-specific restriction endonuclease McrA
MSAQALCLVLDIDYRPLRVDDWKRAFSDVMIGKQEVVVYSRDRTIQGVSQTYPMPAVVRVLRRFKRDRIRIKFSRLNIYARDGFACQYCGGRFPTEDLTFDHVVPRAQGGKTCWENIVTCCGGPGGCNATKADRTPAQAGMRLLRAPRKPHVLPAVMVKMDATRLPEEWRDYWTDSLSS